MPATATARSSTAARGAASSAPARAPSRAPARKRRAPARSGARRGGPRPTTGRFVPVAVGRTAGAVGGIADSGAIVRLTRGQLWIGALAVLLVGIVALNVFALRFNAASGDAARQVDELTRQNSILRGQIATALSRDEVVRAAAGLGLFLPAPDQLRYREPEPGDAAEAARRLRDGELGFGAVSTPASPAIDSPAAPAETAVASDPAAVSDPVVSEPAAAEVASPVAPEPAPVAEPPPTPAPAAAGGLAPQ